MSLYDCTLDYLLRAYDIEELKDIIKGYNNLIDRNETLMKSEGMNKYLTYINQEAECQRIIVKKALKIKQGEVKNEKGV